MPDITMCTGEGCPKKETCYRFTAIPGRYQSFFVAPPYKDGDCPRYSPVKEKPDAAPGT